MTKEILKFGKDKDVYILRGVRIAFPQLWEKSKFYGTPKSPLQYGCEVVFTKNSELHQDLSKMIKKRGEQYFGKIKYRTFVQDGDNQRDADGELVENPKEYRLGCKYFKAKTKITPSVYDDTGDLLEVDNGDVYGGCICQVLVSIFKFDYEGRKGLGFNLIGVQKISDAERLSSGKVYDISGDIEKFNLPKELDEDII